MGKKIKASNVKCLAQGHTVSGCKADTMSVFLHPLLYLAYLPPPLKKFPQTCFPFKLQLLFSLFYNAIDFFFLSFTKVSRLTIHYRDTIFKKVTDGILINQFSSLISIFILLDVSSKGSCQPLPSWNSFFIWLPQNHFLIPLIFPDSSSSISCTGAYC